MTKQFYEYPGCYSMLLTCLISYALVYFETSIGAKISSFSRTQTMLILFVICIVSKNVFIPSRANRFIENSNSTQSSASTDAQASSNANRHDKGGKQVKKPKNVKVAAKKRQQEKKEQ